MFSSMKMEKYMESELSGIFQVKLVVKDTWVLGTQFMYMMIKSSFNPLMPGDNRKVIRT